MEPGKLMSVLAVYGADIEGVSRRFCGDIALYEKCLCRFFHQEELAALAAAIDEKRYADAFLPVHTLKGVSGNLGLTPLFEDICKLVEPLRTKNYDTLMEDYHRVMEEMSRLKALLPEPGADQFIGE